jgi:hypothetical protein
VVLHEKAGCNFEAVGLGQQVSAHAASLRLVMVGGSAAAAGGADLALATGALAGAVQGAVGRQDEGSARRQEDPVVDRDALGHEHVHLLDQGGGLDHHSGGQIADDLGVDDARRHEVERELTVRVAHGVAGVVAAVVPHHHGVARRQQVHHLALALVAPLASDDHQGLRRVHSILQPEMIACRSRTAKPFSLRERVLSIIHGTQFVLNRTG